MSPATIGRRLLVHGVVQGVGFRQWTVRTASRLGVAGWVRNRADGTVEVLAHGEPGAVEELLRACRRGPASASVSHVDDMAAEPGPAPGFHQVASV